MLKYLLSLLDKCSLRSQLQLLLVLLHLSSSLWGLQQHLLVMLLLLLLLRVNSLLLLLIYRRGVDKHLLLLLLLLYNLLLLLLSGVYNNPLSDPLLCLHHLWSRESILSITEINDHLLSIRSLLLLELHSTGTGQHTIARELWPMLWRCHSRRGRQSCRK